MVNHDGTHIDEADALHRRISRMTGDFEDFVSLAAHNLRQSLRDVTAFSQLLAESHGGSLDGEAAHSLARIQDGAAAMQSLLTDTVDYWATGVTGDANWTEMEAVLCHAMLRADRQIAQRGAVVTHDPLPAVCGDFEALAKVMHHLIRNAIEYCVEPTPLVHISSRRAELDWVISVRDNGPGVEAAFQDRIFEVFKRLHGMDYPGNGLGLAYCRKVIEAYGGRIGVESTGGQGSAFYFTLPAAE